ncbi:MAG: alpha-ketoacid dehydrogenase subunit beta [Elusimicrobia bacterium HGW-Elusimicrobia-2]|nr:MAG: alpha-ketoacid dehydrogenase subunit beta [Elusimicrobia bacterium HGW-Elusimicrobia-2]
MRLISYAEAINEATFQLMDKNPSVFVMGLGVTDKSGVFGTTLKARAKFPDRVIGLPIAENAMTGIALGAAAGGMRPIFTHQRMDFLPMAMDQIINHLAKWKFSMGGKGSAPVVIRAIIGQGVGGGWGQACQHAQSLQAIFAHIPGLQVVMPYTAFDAKGMLIASVCNDAPVIFIEHRHLHGLKGDVPRKMYEVQLGKAAKLRTGKDVTIVGLSAMNIKIKIAVDELSKYGFDAEWIDLRSLKPWDEKMILKSVRKTKRLIVADTGHKSFGAGSEIIATLAEKLAGKLKGVKRISLPDMPVPAGPTIEKEYYPCANDIINAVFEMYGKKPVSNREYMKDSEPEVDFKEAF